MSIYGVSTANPFALLDEDYEPPESIPIEETVDVKPKLPQTTRPHTQSDRRGRGRSRGRGRGEPAPVGGGGYRNHTSEGSFSGEGTRSSRGRFGRGNRGNTGGAPPSFRGKREYDRRDGTGRGHELEKRHGGGKGNWGVSTELEFTPNEDPGVTMSRSMDDTQSPPGDQVDEVGKPKDTEESPDGEETGEKKEEDEKKVEEKQLLTLAEYEAKLMMEEKKSKLIATTKKEAPVVVDTKQFDGMAELKKSKIGSGFEALEVERIRRKKEKREKEVSTVEVFFKVGEPLRRGRGGRGRGGGRSRDFDGEAPGQRWTNGAGPSTGDFPRQDSGSGNPYFRGRGRRGSYRGGRGGRSSYGEQASRHSSHQGVDISSENAFPALS